MLAQAVLDGNEDGVTPHLNLKARMAFLCLPPVSCALALYVYKLFRGTLFYRAPC